MGVNAEAYVSHGLERSELEQLDVIFNASLPAFMGPWSFDCPPNAENISEGMALLDGNGYLVHFGMRTANIWSPSRWRGFLIFPETRNNFRVAVLQIAKVLRSKVIVWAPDSQMHTYDEFGSKSSTIDAFIQCLERDGFRRLPAFDSIDDEIVNSARAGQVSAFIIEELG